MKLYYSSFLKKKIAKIKIQKQFLQLTCPIWVSDNVLPVSGYSKIKDEEFDLVTVNKISFAELMLYMDAEVRRSWLR